MSRRRSLLSSVAVALCVLGAVAPLAGASSPVDTLSVAQTAAGKQLVLTGTPADEQIFMLYSDPYGPQNIVRFEAPEHDITFAIDRSAQDRCTFHAADPAGSGVLQTAQYATCVVDGLLTPTATIKPLRVDLSNGGRDSFNAFNSILAVQVTAGDGPGTGITGSGEDDLITGGTGDDQLYGEGGNDVIDGGPGNDVVFGADGDDVLDGGSGHDFLFGDVGRDALNGGPGDDLLELSEHQSFRDQYEPAPTGPGDVADQPASCGQGNDTAWRYDDEADPLTSDASCETDILEPSATPEQVHGTLAVGSTLTATRPVKGSQPDRRLYGWLTCPKIGLSEASTGCVQRSTCQTFRLEAEDIGKTITLVTREAFAGSDDRYEIQQDDERMTLAGTVGPAGPAGTMPGPQVTAPVFRDGDTWKLEWLGQGPAKAPTVPFSDMPVPVFHGVAESHLQADCPPLDVNGLPPGGVTPTATPAPDATPAETATPVPTAPPTPTATPAPAVAPAPAVSATFSARAADGQLKGTLPQQQTDGSETAAQAETQRLAKTLASALAELRRGALRGGGTFTLAAVPGRVSVKVQVHPPRRPKAWVTVAHGVALAGQTRVDVVAGPIGRSRLSAATGTRDRVRGRVVVALIDRGAVSISTRAVSLRR